MRRFIALSILLSICSLTYAAEGDTTIVRSHDKQHLKFPPGNRTYTNKVEFPDGSKTYRKILLAYELGCPSTGCSTWDYDTEVFVVRPSGNFDSTMQSQAFFEVDGNAPDSFYISVTPTYQTFFDGVNMITDSAMSDTVFIDEYRDGNNPTSITNSFFAFETGYYKYYYNTAGTVIDSVYENGDSLWHQGYHTWYNVFEIKETIEVGRLITPYGEPSGVDYYPYTYVFEITDYAPILIDSMDVALQFSGWQDGFIATLDFIFIEGTPPRTPERLIHLYNGYYAYGNASNPINPRLTAYNLAFNSKENFAQLNYTVTGHGADNSGCSEFCSRDYYVKVDGSTKITKEVWKDDCGYNPIYPQGGTWLYDRANWCPGLPGYTDRHELTPFLNAGGSGEIKVDFQNHTASGGSPGYRINGNIITFGPVNHSLDASVEEILAPNDNWLHGRYNPICNKPKIRIKNTGSTDLTSLKITYGAKGGALSVYNWTGNLKFLETEEVELDRPSWARTDNVFEVSISDPNGGTDEYASNNSLSSTFEAPDEMPFEFRIFYRTNDRSSSENALAIQDANGTTVYSRFGVQNNFLYQDTLSLVGGCYTLTLTDNGKDGLEFWAGSQSNGYLRFHRMENMAAIKTFNSDFGTQIDYQFTVGGPLSVNEKMDEEFELEIYPNPSEGVVYVDGFTNEESPIVEVFDQIGKKVPSTSTYAGNGRWMIELQTPSKGLFTVRVVSNSKMKSAKVLFQ